MYIAITFWVTQVALLATGYNLITSIINKKKRTRNTGRYVAKGIFNKIIDKISSRKRVLEMESFFDGIGIKINPIAYSTIRNLTLIFMSAAILIRAFTTKHVAPFNILLLLLLAYITLPQKRLFGITTPMYYTIQILRNIEQQRIDRELSKLLTILKNLAITSKQKPLSTETVISILIRFSTKTRSVFTEYQSLYRLNKLDEAYEMFKKKTACSRLGETFASILTKLDTMNPSEMVNQITIAQEAARENMVTRRIANDKMASDIAFIPILLQIVALLINFAAIVMFIDTMKQLTEIFIM